MTKWFSRGLIVYLENGIFFVFIFQKCFFDLKLKEGENKIDTKLMPYGCFKLEELEGKLTSIEFSKNEEQILFGFQNAPYIQLPVLFILKKTDKK